MKNFVYILFLITIPFKCFPQNEANNWYFGENAGLNFNGVEPEPLGGQLNTGEGCASISDADGNLLFYTDGVTVYNRNHGVMLNGTALNGDFSSTHSAIIVPKPNSSSIYYIFTSDDDGEENGLQYSEVDMELEFGLGGVTANKNILLYTPITEKLTAIKHATLNEYWVISHKFPNNEFIVYNVSEDGVDDNPIISVVGAAAGNSARGQIKVSPDGTKLAVARTGDENTGITQLFDFDAANGQVSNPRDILTYFGASLISNYGVEFSPDSQFLYLSSGVGVFQYNLAYSTIEDVLLSQYTVTINSSSTYGYGGMQLGPNGKIYIAEWENPYLHVINAPNDLGEDCNYEEDGLYLSGKKSRLGLPPFIQSFFVVGFQVDNLCEGNNAMFNANISQSYDSLLWDFGDGNTSVQENPLHIFDNPGDYEVTLTVTSGTESSTEVKTITVYELPSVSALVELKQCDDDLDGFSRFNLNEVIPEITNNYESETITFHHTQFDAENNHNPIINDSSYINQNTSSDTVWARVENLNGCYETSQVNLYVSTTQIPSTFFKEYYQCDDGADTFDGIASFDFSSVISEIEGLFQIDQELIINFYDNLEDALAETEPILDISNYQNTNSPNVQHIYVRVDSVLNNDCLGLGHYIDLNVITLPEINSLPNFAIICEGGYIELIVEPDYDYYSWSTGDITRGITVDEPGEYTVTASNIYNDLVCSITKTVIVTDSNVPLSVGIETQDWTQNNNTILILAEGPGSYEYSIDGMNYQDNNLFTGLTADEYTVFIRDKNGCGVVSENVYLIYYPRYFTPNSDGQNDVWQIINSVNEPLNMLYIYDRYGKLIKQLKPYENGWDGTYRGEKMPSSDYWFILERQNGKTYNGHFTLKR